MQTKIQVTIDSHLRLSKKDLKRVGIPFRKLCILFEYANPDFWKKKRLGFYTGETPRIMTLVRVTENEIMLPRGGWERLKKFMLMHSIKLEVINKMISGTGPLGLIYAEPKEWILSADQLTAAKMALNFKQGLIKGVCGCLHASTEIYDPIDGSRDTVEKRFKRKEPFHVISFNGKNNIIALAYPPIKYPVHELLEIKTSSGTFCVTPNHLIASSLHGWVRAFDLATYQHVSGYLPEFSEDHLQSNSEYVQRDLLLNAQHLMNRVLNFQGDYHQQSHLYDEQLPFDKVYDQSFQTLYNDAQVPILDSYDHKSKHNHLFQFSYPQKFLEFYKVFEHALLKKNLDGSLFQNVLIHLKSYSLLNPISQQLQKELNQIHKDIQLQRDVHHSIYDDYQSYEFQSYFLLKLLLLIYSSNIPPQQLHVYLNQIYKDVQLLHDAHLSIFDVYSFNKYNTYTDNDSIIKSIKKIKADNYYDFHVPVTNCYVAAGHLHHNSGKTEILLHFISETKEKSLVIVHTERLLRQWQAKAAERFFVKKDEIGLLYGKVKKEKNFTVGMVQTVLNIMDKEKDFIKKWGCIVNDEVHHASATTFSKLINSFPAKYRIGATATLKRKDGKSVLVYDCFGSTSSSIGKKVSVKPKILFEITDADLDEHGRIVPVDVIVVPTDFEFDLHWQNRIEKEGLMTLENKMTSLAMVKKWAKQTSFTGPLNTYSDMLDSMSNDIYRRARILEYLLPQLKNGSTSLLFADRREFCLTMQAWLKRRKINCGRLMGGKNSKEQDKTIEGLNNGTLNCAVGTTVGDEGLDIPRLSRGFGCTPTASNPSRLVQQMGRFKRIFDGKVDAKYFYFWDRKVKGLKSHCREVFKAIKHPHRVWYSKTPDKIVPLTINLLKKIERKNNV